MLALSADPGLVEKSFQNLPQLSLYDVLIISLFTIVCHLIDIAHVLSGFG